MMKYGIIDRTGTRSFGLALEDRCLLSQEVVAGIQAEVLKEWPQWTVALVGYCRDGDIVSISSHSVTQNSENIDDLALFMQQFADEEMSERELLFGPLERQKWYVEFQLRQSVTITEDRPFQIVAICENWSKPDEYV